MTDFTIQTTDVSVIDADFAVNSPSELNNITRGDTATFVFQDPTTRLTVAANETYTVAVNTTERIDFVEVLGGTLEINGTLEVDSIVVTGGGTIDNNGTLKANEQFALELEELQRYERYAGNYSINATLDATQTYRDRLPDDATADTLLIGIEPSSSLKDKDVVGVWGLVSDITDSRNQPLSINRISITLDILAPYDKYDDTTAVENALKL